MIDIHSHIIFDVDDGPKTLEDSRRLLEESYRQGVRTIISTSHRRKGMFETPEEKIAANFKQVQELAKQVADDLTVLYAEYFCSKELKSKLSVVINHLCSHTSKTCSFYKTNSGIGIKSVQQNTKKLYP